jgi:hypothetical protein
MSENLHCSEGAERRLYEIRDRLYAAVQAHIADDTESARTATKEAYEHLSTLLDSLQSNLKPPAGGE